MDDEKINCIMHIMFIVLFTLLAMILHGIIQVNNTNIDKIVQVADKANVECQIKTNNVLYMTIKKIVK